ncbi:hypothetical protein [Glaciihabitans sp. UYNi722]|uniref:hypothetical protein n=1 Tax=Glaciihabitans sp. UYNi722 TaxID=3156344 RepID=UPI003396049D
MSDPSQLPPPPQPVDVQYAQAQPTNSLPVAGFVLGIISATFALCFALIGVFIGFVPAVLAIVFGFVGQSAAKRMGGLHMRIAKWSAGLGIITFVLPLAHAALSNGSIL